MTPNLLKVTRLLHPYYGPKLRKVRLSYYDETKILSSISDSM